MDNSATVRFENVDIADANGNIIEYEVKELDANGNILKDGDMVTLGGRKYKVTYDEYGNITNSEPIDITVNKVWDNNVPVSERKSVEVALINDDKEVATAVLNDANGWKFTFKDLPRVLGGYIVKETKINGLKIDDSFSRLYDIDEDGCPIEETTEVTIKNTYTKPYECGGTKKLPKTGGTSSEYLVVLGLGLIGLGYAFKKRR